MLRRSIIYNILSVNGLLEYFKLNMKILTQLDTIRDNIYTFFN